MSIHSPSRALVAATFAFAIALAMPAGNAAAQTDYYNTDAGRPLWTEDAYPVERRAIEFQLAPLRLERAHGAAYTWAVEPEVAFGLLPATQLEIGVPLVYGDAPAGSRSGIGGVEIALLHNLNVETSIPALALGADVLLPVGALAPDRAYASAKAIATRTFSRMRLHLNGRYTFGEAPAAAAPGHGELSRWAAGLAVDRTMPLRSLLVGAEVVARQPMHETEDLRWETAVGTRYQLGPRVAMDGGAGYRLTGDDQGWFVTFGAAYVVGMPWRAR